MPITETAKTGFVSLNTFYPATLFQDDSKVGTADFSSTFVANFG